MYHYVRDVAGTRFPRLKALPVDAFRRQVDALRATHEMATWESLASFLSGEYVPRRDLCYLTFDDGLREHHETVLPILQERGVKAAFFVITGCANHEVMATVHQSQLLAAVLDEDQLLGRFRNGLAELAPGTSVEVDDEAARRTYRWDSRAMAGYKYLINVQLPVTLRETVIALLCAQELGDLRALAGDHYMGWGEIDELHRCGMVVGGHTHFHRALSSLTATEQRDDLTRCYGLLASRLGVSGAGIPFCYPYGSPDAFTSESAKLVRASGFVAGFTAIAGRVRSGDDPYTLRRFDTRDVVA